MHNVKNKKNWNDNCGKKPLKKGEKRLLKSFAKRRKMKKGPYEKLKKRGNEESNNCYKRRE